MESTNFENKQDYKGIHGFRNGAPAYASNNWADVDLFLHTWDFLPGDNSVLETLTKEQLMELLGMALSATCRIDLENKGIKYIQEKMHNYGISPIIKNPEVVKEREEKIIKEVKEKTLKEVEDEKEAKRIFNKYIPKKKK